MNFERLGCSMERHEIQDMLPIISSVEQGTQIGSVIFYYFMGANFYDITKYGLLTCKSHIACSVKSKSQTLLMLDLH